ncbi:MAG TPA: hypothetical protein VIK01_15680 [Polyangiaceae bacterium]
MSLAEIIALEVQLGRERRECDGHYGRAMQILHRLENEWREQQRNERLTVAERRSLESTQ